MNWQKLIEVKSEFIKVGTVFRFPTYSYFSGENIVEIMLCKTLSKSKIFEFFIISGYKSGHCFAFIPRNIDTNGDHIRLSWLLKNWYVYVDPMSNLNDVYIFRRKENNTLFSLKR